MGPDAEDDDEDIDGVTASGIASSQPDAATPDVQEARIMVFANGACYFSGTRRMCGAYGINIGEGDEHPENVGCFTHAPGITNQSMQLLAVQAALRVLQRLTGASQQNVVCVTSSAYFVKFVQKWSVIWERTGWTTKSREPVKNIAVLQELLRLIRETKTSIELRSIDTCAGLQKARALADAAAAEGGRVGCRIRRCNVNSCDLLGLSRP
jgi:ribonuclease HI